MNHSLQSNRFFGISICISVGVFFNVGACMAGEGGLKVFGWVVMSLCREMNFIHDFHIRSLSSDL